MVIRSGWALSMEAGTCMSTLRVSILFVGMDENVQCHHDTFFNN